MANNEHTRAEYIQALLNQKKLNQANGGVIMNPSVPSSTDIEGLANLNTDITNKEVTKTQDNRNDLQKGLDNINGFIAELGTNFFKGFFGAFEGFADLGATGLGALGDATGWYDGSTFTDWAKINVADNFGEWYKTYYWGAKGIQNVGNLFNAEFWSDSMNTLGKAFTSSENFREQNAQYNNYNSEVLNDMGETGEFLGGIAHSVGFMLPSIATGTSASALGASENVAKGLSLGSMGISASGKQSEEALNDGATSGQALASGLISGTVEVVSEIVVGKMLEGLAKGLKLEKLLGKFGNINGVDLSGKILKQSNAKQLITNFIEEGAEEVFSEAFAPHIQAIYKGDKAFYDANGQHILKGEWWKSAGKSFLSGGIVGGLSGSAQNFSNTQKYSKNGLSLFENNARAGEIIEEYKEELNKIKKGEPSTPRMVELENEFKETILKIDENFKSLMENKTSKGKQYLRNVMDAFYGNVDTKGVSPKDVDSRITAITDERVQNFKNEMGKDIYQRVVDSYNDALSRSGVNLHVNLVDDGTNRGFIITKDGEVIINRKYAKEMGQIFKHEAISHGILDMNEDLKNNLVKFIEENDSENYHKLDDVLKGVDRDGKRLYTDEEIEKYERLATYLESKLTNSTELAKVFARNSATKSKLIALLNKIENNFKKSGDVIDDKIVKTLDKAIKQLKKTQSNNNTKSKSSTKYSKKLKNDKYARFKFEGEEFNPNPTNANGADAETRRNEFIDNVSMLLQNYGDYQYEQVGTYETMIKKPYIKAINEGIAIVQSIYEDVFNDFINYEDGDEVNFTQHQLESAVKQIEELKEYVDEVISEIENVDWNGYDPEYYDLQAFSEEFAEEFLEKAEEFEVPRDVQYKVYNNEYTKEELGDAIKVATENVSSATDEFLDGIKNFLKGVEKYESDFDLSELRNAINEREKSLKQEQEKIETKQENKPAEEYSEKVRNALRQVRKMKDRYDGNDWIKQLRAKFTLSSDDVGIILQKSLESGLITQQEFNSAVDELGIEIKAPTQEVVEEKPQPKFEEKVETKTEEKKVENKPVEAQNTDNKVIASPITYQGSKRVLMPKIIDKLPKTISGNFIDAFSGSLTVSLNVNYDNIIANELNPAIYGLQNYFKHNTPKYIVTQIQKIIKENDLRTEAGFNKFLTKFNTESETEKNHWLNLFIIQKLSTLQHTYVMDNGKIDMANVGFDKKGGLKDFKSLEKKITEFHNKVMKMTLSNKNAFDVIKDAKSGDLIYVDPPYLNTNAPYNGQWTETDDRNLYYELDNATKRGVKWVMSNSVEGKGFINKFLQSWIRKYETEHVDKSYYKQEHDEIIVRNYNDKGDVIDLSKNKTFNDVGSKYEYDIENINASEWLNADLRKEGLENYLNKRWAGMDISEKSNFGKFIRSVINGETSLFENDTDTRKAFRRYLIALQNLQAKKGSPNPFSAEGQLKNAYFTPEMQRLYYENVRIGFKNTLFFENMLPNGKTLTYYDGKTNTLSYSLDGLISYFADSSEKTLTGNSIQQLIRLDRAKYIQQNRSDFYHENFETKLDELFNKNEGLMERMTSSLTSFDKNYNRILALAQSNRGAVETWLNEFNARNGIKKYTKVEFKGMNDSLLARLYAQATAKDEIYARIYSQEVKIMDFLQKEKVLGTKISRIVNDFTEQLGKEVKQDIKFSKSLNSDGDALSTEQEKYFENSKVRDENGNLLVMYHGTRADFNEFKYNNANNNTGGVEIGHWFTDNETFVFNMAYRGRGKGNPDIKKIYLNITNPLTKGQYRLSSSEIDGIVNKVINKCGIDLQEFAMNEFGVNIEETNKFYIADRYYNKLLKYDFDDWGFIEKIARDISDYGGDFTAVREYLKYLGYDGMRYDNKKDSGWNEGNTWVAFKSNQVKAVDNYTPTDSEDIRYARALPTYKDMETTEDILDRVEQKVKDTLGTDYHIKYPKSYESFKHRAFTEINNVADVNKKAEQLLNILEKATIEVENVTTHKFDVIDTIGNLLTPTTKASLLTEITNIISASANETARSSATRSYELQIERLVDTVKETDKAHLSISLAKKIAKYRNVINQNYQITEDAISRDGLTFLFKLYTNLHNLSKGYSAKTWDWVDVGGTKVRRVKAVLDNINEILSFYNEDIINPTNYPNIPYEDVIRDKIIELRDSLGEPVTITLKSGKTRTTYGSLSVKSLKIANELAGMIEHVNKKAKENAILKIRPSAEQSYKGIENMRYGMSVKFIADTWRSYKRGFAPAYVVVGEMLGGNTQISQLATRDIQNATNGKILYIGGYNDAVNKELKRLDLTRKYDTKKFEVNKHTLEADQFVNLYISLNVQANYDAINESGIQYYDEHHRLKTLAPKGKASELKAEVDRIIPSEYKAFGDFLLKTINTGIKTDYIKWYEDRFGAYNRRNEIGEIGSNDYWFLNRSYQKYNSVERALKNPKGVFNHAKSRTDTTENMVVIGGALAGFNSYVKSLANEIHVKPVYRQIVSVLNQKTSNGKSIMNLLAEKVDPKDVKYLQTTLDDVLGVIEMKKSPFTEAMAKFSVAKLSLNVATLFKQYASIFTSNLPISATAKGFFANIFSNEDVKTEFATLVNEIGGLKYRESQKGVIQANADGISGLTERVAEIGMYGISKMDYFTISTGVVSLMYIGENQFGYKIGTQKNIDFVKRHWADFELTQIGNGALSKNGIRRGDSDSIAKAVFGFLQGANTENLGSQLTKINLWQRNHKLKKSTLETNKTTADTNVTNFETAHPDLNNLTESEQDEYVDLKQNQIDAKLKLEDYERYEIARGKLGVPIPINIASGLIAQGLFVTLISEMFKRIKGKKDWDDWNIAEVSGSFALSTLVDWVPLVNTISSLFKGYEVNVPSVTMLNEISNIVTNFYKGDYKTMIRKLSILIGDACGIPVETISSYLYGALKQFSPEMAWDLGTVLYGSTSTTASKSLKTYAEKGNQQKTTQMMSIVINKYRGVESTDSVNQELSKLYINGYKVVPQQYMTEYTDEKGETISFTEEQATAFKQVYSLSTAQIDETIKLQDYKSSTQEERSKILKKIYDAYYQVAKAKVTGISPISRLAQYIVSNNGNVNIGQLVIYLNKIANITDNGVKTRKELVFDYVNKLRSLSKQEKLDLLALAGYSVSSKK